MADMEKFYDNLIIINLYLTLEANALKNRIFGIYIFYWTAISNLGFFYIFFIQL